MYGDNIQCLKKKTYNSIKNVYMRNILNNFIIKRSYTLKIKKKEPIFSLNIFNKHNTHLLKDVKSI